MEPLESGFGWHASQALAADLSVASGSKQRRSGQASQRGVTARKLKAAEQGPPRRSACEHSPPRSHSGCWVAPRLSPWHYVFSLLGCRSLRSQGLAPDAALAAGLSHDNQGGLLVKVAGEYIRFKDPVVQDIIRKVRQ